MRNRAKFTIGIVVGALAVLTSGCATVMDGNNQKVHITTSPPGALVTARPGNHAAEASGDLWLPRGEGPYVLRVQKEGYGTEEVTVEPGMNSSAYLNLLAAGPLGGVVDLLTGAAFELSPADIHVELKKADLAQRAP